MKILITGGASGIGYSLATYLAKRKHTVYITTHTENQKKRTEEKIKKKGLAILVFKMDITDQENRKLIEKLEIDCLVSHAGIGEGGAILEMNLEKLKENYEVNIFSNFSLIQEFYQIQKRKKKKGKIFVTSSLASGLPIPYLGCYTSSKAAISMLTKTIKKELKKEDQITISLIEPGAYHTGFNQVMIESKIKNMQHSSLDLEKINQKQKKLFQFLEKKSTISIVKKVAREIEKDHPKFKIKAPLLQAIGTKLYLVLFW